MVNSQIFRLLTKFGHFRISCQIFTTNNIDKICIFCLHEIRITGQLKETIGMCFILKCYIMNWKSHMLLHLPHLVSVNKCLFEWKNQIIKCNCWKHFCKKTKQQMFLANDFTFLKRGSASFDLISLYARSYNFFTHWEHAILKSQQITQIRSVNMHFEREKECYILYLKRMYNRCLRVSASRWNYTLIFSSRDLFTL